MSVVAAPLVALTELAPDLYAKVEYLHPSGSIKHRALPPLIEDRARAGLIRAGQRIAVPSAGAAAVSVAWAAARLGHPALALLPRSAPPAIVRLLGWMGADCRLLEAAELPDWLARLRADPHTYLLEPGSDRQVPDHYQPVVDEILRELPGAQAITAGVGTGATVAGLGRGLRRRESGCRLVAVEPAEAQVAAGGPWAPHGIPGLAPPIPQPLFESALVAEVLPVPSAEAWVTARRVHRQVGLPLGPSSGAAVAAALALRARGLRGPVVAVCPCAMSEYLELAPPSG